MGGGFLFSVPLLYTMEVWWAGFTVSPSRLLIGMAATFLLLCAFNAYAGLRYDSGLAEILIDSVEELGLGLGLSALILFALARIHSGMAPLEILGKVVVEALFVAIGVSIGTAQLGGGGDDAGSRAARRRTAGSEVALALCGAVLVAANVGPTEEIVLLAAGMKAPHLLGAMALSMALALTLLYFSDFRGSGHFTASYAPPAMIEAVALTYAVGLLASWAILWFFGRFEGQPATTIVSQGVVLALPATLGAAAGRLLLR